MQTERDISPAVESTFQSRSRARQHCGLIEWSWQDGIQLILDLLPFDTSWREVGDGDICLGILVSGEQEKRQAIREARYGRRAHFTSQQASSSPLLVGI